MQATPECSTWSAIAKASAKVVRLVGDPEQVLVGDDDQRVDAPCGSSAMPDSAMRMRCWPSKWNGLVTTPTVRMPMLAGGLGDDRGGAGAGAAAHAGGDEHHMGAGEVVADFVDDFLGRGRADIGLRTGAQALGDLGAHLDDALRLRHGERLRVGVGDDEIDPLQSGRDHVVDGIAAGAADAEHRDPRLQLVNVRDVEIDGHGCLSITRALVRLGRRPRELVKVEWARKRFIRSPHEAIDRLFRNSRQSLS